jgi:hypothetical protein
MAQYPELAKRLGMTDPDALTSDADLLKQIIEYLIDIWLADYTRTNRGSEIVETRAAEFSYLFDIPTGRLIAAWGLSKGRHGGARDATRMAGHPLSAGSLYHRGHAIPHTLGGPTDINLVPQLGRINIGPFRPLEKKAVATPGSFYFTYWLYPPTLRASSAGQLPTGVDQGLVIPGRPPAIDIRTHGN